MCENVMENFIKRAGTANVAVEAISMILFFIINGKLSAIERNEDQMIFHKKLTFFI